MIVKSFLNSNFEIKITHSSLNCYNIEDILNTNRTYLPLSISSTAYPAIKEHEANKNMAQHLVSAAAKNFSLGVGQKLAELPTVLTKKTQFTSETKYAFWILAAIQLPAALILFAAKKAGLIDVPEEDTGAAESANGPEFIDLSEGKPSSGYLITLFKKIPFAEMTILISSLVFLFEGLQVII